MLYLAVALEPRDKISIKFYLIYLALSMEWVTE